MQVFYNWCFRIELRINFNVCLSTKSAHTLSDYVLKKRDDNNKFWMQPKFTNTEERMPFFCQSHGSAPKS